MLHMACAVGNYDAVDCLLNKGAYTEVLNTDNDTPIQLATYNQQLDVIILLISNGAKFDVYDNVRKKQSQKPDSFMLNSSPFCFNHLNCRMACV